MPIPRIYLTGIQARRKLPSDRFFPWSIRVFHPWTLVQVIELVKENGIPTPMLANLALYISVSPLREIKQIFLSGLSF